MEKTPRKLFSWSRFNTEAIGVVPELLAATHSFDFEGASIVVTLPGADGVSDQDNARAEVDRRLTATNEPIDYSINQVDVVVLGNASSLLPDEILSRPINAYDLFSATEISQLDSLVKSHESTAKSAFRYWLRVARWTCDDYRIGEHVVRQNEINGMTRLKDEATGQEVWAPPMEFTARGGRTIERFEWELMRSRLENTEQPPVYRDFLHAAEAAIEARDFRRALVDLAIASETYLRAVVFRKLPEGLTDKIKNYLDQANVAQYLNHFLEETCPELVQRIGARRFKKLREELHSLFGCRNRLVHSGDSSTLDRNVCERFRLVTRELLDTENGQRAESDAT